MLKNKLNITHYITLLCVSLILIIEFILLQFISILSIRIDFIHVLIDMLSLLTYIAIIKFNKNTQSNLSKNYISLFFILLYIYLVIQETIKHLLYGVHYNSEYIIYSIYSLSIIFIIQFINSIVIFLYNRKHIQYNNIFDKTIAFEILTDTQISGIVLLNVIIIYLFNTIKYDYIFVILILSITIFKGYKLIYNNIKDIILTHKINKIKDTITHSFKTKYNIVNVHNINVCLSKDLSIDCFNCHIVFLEKNYSCIDSKLILDIKKYLINKFNIKCPTFYIECK